MIKRIAYQVLKAVDFCHSHNVIILIKTKYLNPQSNHQLNQVHSSRCQTRKHFDHQTKRS